LTKLSKKESILIKSSKLITNLIAEPVTIMNKSITTKKSKLVFGFDVGTNSVGWAAIKSNLA